VLTLALTPRCGATLRGAYASASFGEGKNSDILGIPSLKKIAAVIGRHLNNYEVVSLLGEGGMGTVYLALHPIMGRKAAVKVLKPELAKDESLVTRFFNEARAANAIRHPNIIDIIDVGMLPDDNVPYMLMEFLEGESLASRLDRARPLDAEQAVEIAFQTASALAAAHSKGIVHRDLKPDNLFLVPDEMVGSGERVKVLDFGIAKLRDDMRGSSMKTRTGAIMGTAAYMSPEQCQGLIERIDHRTDIYALGIILYEMVCGAPPFISEGFGDIIIMHVMKEPDPPHLKNPAVPIEVSEAILRALAKNPEDRFQSMFELQGALRASGAHSSPIRLTPPVVPLSTTAILPESRAPSRVPLSRPPSGYDATIATPAPITLPPVRRQSPSAHPVGPAAATKQSTTFRNATGESIEVDLDFGSSSKRKTMIAVAAIVGLAAAGLAITVLVTRPSGSKTPEPAAAATHAPASTPAPEPTPPARFTPPPEPAPTFAPPPAAPEPTPVPVAAEEPVRSHKKGKGPKKGGEVTVSRPERPSTPTAPPPPPPPPSHVNTERW
jgi:eukaryotic-like serine/threonine-protein kinase